MIGKVILSGIAAGMTIYFMAQTDNPTLQLGGAIVSSSAFGFTTTRLLLDEERERKARAAEARAYVLMLRRMNQERLRRHPPMPKACRGCLHFHGRTYNGNYLVCGMHPYGVETETCSDWEQRSEDMSSR
ncbi:hypothetical protein [Leptolyngbya sp. FACHB-711]|jgi:hypothetical protein|uniref:hypothetical protein n=1 Tax=unclassified Leptolyngbya TaxID=2650499 RepID=UPI0016842DEB|nr:hypothetical protein [Leptolyngbya sp. FACHB-711]MBD1849940.1 hypothetical protein [Cyanobacteria bacterium FACHB-502]MBD2025797.1 hypothetical protein [Leptolyngbya sp. FACHB-711]